MKRILLLILLAAITLTTCQDTAFVEVAKLPPTNQSINQPANQPTNTPTNQPTNQPTNTPTNTPTHQPTNTPTPLPPTPLPPTPLPPTPTPLPPTPTPTPRFQQLTTGNCCTDHYWGSDTGIYFIDRNPDSGQTGIWAIDVSGDDFTPRFVTDRLGRYSPNGRYLAYPDPRTGLAIIEDLQTGQSWTLDLNESPVNFAPDGEHIFWIEADQDKPFEERTPVYWISRVDGSDERQIAALPRSSTLDWLDNDTLLISIFDSDEGESRFATRWATVAKFSLLDGSVTPLFRFERPRSVVLNPSKTALVYFTALADDPAQNGIWYVDLTGPDFDLKKLPFVGSYRWLDDTTLIYIPFDTDATSHYFYTYDLTTDQIGQLTGPGMPQLTIANNDWSLSPDRKKIALLAADGMALDGLWLIDLAPGG